MVIREFGDITNFPNILGRKNIPPTSLRAQETRILPRLKLGEQAMALARGETPVHLAQKLRAQFASRANHASGTMRGGGWGFGQRLRIIDRLKSIRGQVRSTGRPNIPTPYERPGTWRPGALIASLPSATGIISGPERTVHGDHISVHAFS